VDMFSGTRAGNHPFPPNVEQDLSMMQGNRSGFLSRTSN
jgi:hypothetical protein